MGFKPIQPKASSTNPSPCTCGAGANSLPMYASQSSTAGAFLRTRSPPSVISNCFLISSHNFQITDITGDIYCEGSLRNPCISEFSVYNPNSYDVTIKNDGVKILFTPSIQKFELYLDNKKVDLNRKGATISFPSKRIIKVKLVGYKNNPKDTVKWTFNSGHGELDPYWNGVYANKIEVIYNG